MIFARVALLPACSACPEHLGDLVGGLPFARPSVLFDLNQAAVPAFVVAGLETRAFPSRRSFCTEESFD